MYNKMTIYHHTNYYSYKKYNSATAGVNNAKAPRFSCTMYCPFCKKNVNTMISYENNSMVWIIAIILFMCTIIFFFIPFLIKDLKDAIHYCPYCRREIARNEKSI